MACSFARYCTAILLCLSAVLDTNAIFGAAPNVVLIVTDDQGYGDLSCHGNPVLQTPNIDRLHSESLRLTDFHVSPMCTPTRGQLLTGQDALRNGAMNVSSGRALLRSGIATLADVFSGNGYQCGQFGKWHLGDNYPYRPHDRGFHEAIWYPSSHIGSAPDYFTNDYLDDVYYHLGQRQKYTGYTTDVFFTEAMHWIGQQVDSGKPFFCYLATAAAHTPLHVPAEFSKRYAEHGATLAAFFGMLANIDENVGRLDRFLHESGLAENTIVVFMTDNGGATGTSVFDAGMRGRKTELFEGGHRVPCFVRWPLGNLLPPRDITSLTQVQDLFPTLVELCQLKVAAAGRVDGVSLAPLLRGQCDELPDRMLVINFSRQFTPTPRKNEACVLWKRWRLIGVDRLYDLDADPRQDANVFNDHREVAAAMTAHLDAWWAEVEPNVSNFSAITVGHDAEPESLLSPADWQDEFLDQGAQVRAGLQRNGRWNIIVSRAGRYEFELRRWPRESSAPLTAGSTATEHDFGAFPAGQALPVRSARIRVFDFESSADVTGDERQITFAASLPAGRTQLQTWFFDPSGSELCGAYYVYVRRE